MFIVFEFLRGCFLNFLSFLQKKNKFWTFWKLSRKNTIRDAFYNKFAKLSDFLKKSSFLSKKTSFFQQIQILNVFRTPKQNYNFRRFLEILLNFCVFEKFQRSFRKKPNSKRFGISWVKTQFDTNCISNMPN